MIDAVIMVLKKGEQHGYVISNYVLQDIYLKVTEEALKAKRVVRFTDTKKNEVSMITDQATSHVCMVQFIYS